MEASWGPEENIQAESVGGQTSHIFENPKGHYPEIRNRTLSHPSEIGRNYNIGLKLLLFKYAWVVSAQIMIRDTFESSLGNQYHNRDLSMLRIFFYSNF